MIVLTEVDRWPIKGREGLGFVCEGISNEQREGLLGKLVFLSGKIRKVTGVETSTLRRGCIGIIAREIPLITFSRLGNHGRLGNQLFQIASTIGIAHILGETPAFPPWDYFPYFKLPEAFFTSYAKGEMTEAYETNPALHIVDPRARDYLQDFSLFEGCAGNVWNWLQPSGLAVEYISSLPQYEAYVDLRNQGKPILSVHVRRGDNAHDPGTPDKWRYHPLRPTSYYTEEIEKLRATHSVMVFSDDPAWCRWNIDGDLFWQSSQPRKKEHEKGYKEDAFDDWVDLFMMSFCDRHIISNSTYSWWGAYLSEDPAPIYPYPFFGSSLDYIDASLMFPDFWVRHDHGQLYS